MVFEKPVIERRELLRALDPVHGRGEDDYTRLREAALLSSGLDPRELGLSAAADHPALYCSLNRDAVTAVRRGHPDIAREAATHARRIEADVLGPWLHKVLHEHPPDSSVIELPADAQRRFSWADHLLVTAPGSAVSEVAEPILSAAQDVAEVRSTLGIDDTRVRLTTGRVWTIDDPMSEVRPDSPHQLPFAFFTEEIFAAGLRLGDPVVIRHEELGPGTFLTTIERGIERSAVSNPASGHQLPAHLDSLVNASALQDRTRFTRPLRHVA